MAVRLGRSNFELPNSQSAVRGLGVGGTTILACQSGRLLIFTISVSSKPRYCRATAIRQTVVLSYGTYRQIKIFVRNLGHFSEDFHAEKSLLTGSDHYLTKSVNWKSVNNVLVQLVSERPTYQTKRD